MNDFHNTSGLLRQIEALSISEETALRMQKPLDCSPVLEGVRRAQETALRMQKALDCSPMLEGVRRAQETALRMQKALDCSPMLEGVRRAQETALRMQKALDCSPVLEGVRRAQETALRMQKALDCSPVLEGVRRAQETALRMQKALDCSPMLEGVRRAQETALRMQKALDCSPMLEGVRRAQETALRMQKALDCSPVLEGVRRAQEAWIKSSLALHRAIQAIRVDALDLRVGHAWDRLVAHAEKARGRDQRRRRLRIVGQTATNWLGRLASRRKVRPPVGSSLRGVAEFVFSKKSFEQIYDPLISDLRIEYCEALAENRRGKARWVRARGYGSFLAAVLAHVATSGGHLVVRVWRIFQVGG